MMMMSRRFLLGSSRGNVRLKSSITESLETYIEVLLRRYESVSEEASSMEADNSQSALLRRGREMKFLSPVYELQKRRKECKDELESIEEMLAELSKNEEDRELGELLLQDRETYETDLVRVESDLLKRLVPVDSADDCDAILEVQAGAGRRAGCACAVVGQGWQAGFGGAPRGRGAFQPDRGVERCDKGSHRFGQEASQCPRSAFGGRKQGHDLPGQTE